MTIALLRKCMLPVALFCCLWHCETGAVFAKQLRQAVQDRDVACYLKGDGTTTSSCDLVVLNKTDRVQGIEVPAFQVLVPTSRKTQTMMSTTPESVKVKPGKAVVTHLSKVCISPKNVPPPGNQAQACLPGSPALATVHKEIFQAATSLEAKNGLSTLPLLAANRLQTVAQLAIWREIGLSTPSKEDDVTKDTIKTNLLESAHVDPNSLTKSQKDQIDESVAAIFAAVDLTQKNAHAVIARAKEGQPALPAQPAAAQPPAHAAGRGSGPYVVPNTTIDSDTTDDADVRTIVFTDKQGNTNEVRISADGHAVHRIKMANSDVICQSEYDVHISGDGSRIETEAGDRCRRTIAYGSDGSLHSDTWDERIGKGSAPGSELWRSTVTTYQPDGTHTDEVSTREVPTSGSVTGPKQASSKQAQSTGTASRVSAPAQNKDAAETVSTDGTRTVRYPDGTMHIRRRNGITITVGTDGTRVARRPSTTVDGGRVVEDTPPPAGRVGLDLHNGWFRTQDTDGTIILTSPDGTEIVRRPDGTQVITKADGTPVPLRSDGDTEFSDPSGRVFVQQDGSVRLETRERLYVGEEGRAAGYMQRATRPVYRNELWTTTIGPSGITVVQRDDGSTVTRHPDGTTITRGANGEESSTYPDGTRRQTYPDGTTVKEKPDGTQAVTTPDGRSRVRRPGDWESRTGPAEESLPASAAEPDVSP